MHEYNIEIEIDEDGNIKADAKGFKDATCADELDKILENIDGQRDTKNKPEYYNGSKNKRDNRVKNGNN